VLDILARHVGEDNPQVRSAVARALGHSGDVRRVPVLSRMLNDPNSGVCMAVAEGVCELLGWKRPEVRSDQQLDAWLEDLKAALPPVLDLPPVLEALERLQKATKQAGL